MIRLAVVALAAVFAVIACTGGDGDSAPEVTFEGLDGASLYSQACASCHGTELTGTDQGPPFLDAIYVPGHHADGAFFVAAKAGARAHHWNFGSMDPVPGLTDEQIGAIITFVRAQQRAAGFE